LLRSFVLRLASVDKTNSAASFAVVCDIACVLTIYNRIVSVL